MRTIHKALTHLHARDIANNASNFVLSGRCKQNAKIAFQSIKSISSCLLILSAQFIRLPSTHKYQFACHLLETGFVTLLSEASAEKEKYSVRTSMNVVTVDINCSLLAIRFEKKLTILSFPLKWSDGDNPWQFHVFSAPFLL